MHIARVEQETMSSGWRYSVQIPDFTKEERHGEEIVVYYQVDVLVQAPGTNEPAPPTTVWRRFSEFRQLHSNLKGSFPELFRKKELEPPSKKSLRFVNNNDRLLHERRQQLEAWLWNLLSSNEIAHSRYMKVFLQLNLAVRGATASNSVAASTRDANEDEEPLDTSSELSAPSGLTNLSQCMTEALTPGTAKFSTKTESVDAYRMGMRVGQRRELKQLMRIICTSLEKVSQEAQEVRSENRSLLQENQSLEEKMTSLNQMIKDGKYAQDEHHEELRRTIEEKETHLQKMTEAVSRLEASLKESQRHCESLEAQVQAVREEGVVVREKHLAEVSAMESKLQQHAVSHAKLDQALLETKQKARQDNRFLAEAVKTLRTEKQGLAEKVKSQEDQLKEQASSLNELQSLKETQIRDQKEKQELEKRIEDLQNELVAAKQSAEDRVKAAEMHASSALEALTASHAEEKQALQQSISNAENNRDDALAAAQQTRIKERDALQQELAALHSADASGAEFVRLVLKIQAPGPTSEAVTAPQSSEGLEAQGALEQLQQENAELKETLKRLQETDEASQEMPQQTNGIERATSDDAANLEGLMMTIQQLQEQNQVLQQTVDESEGADVVSALEKFAEGVDNLYSELRDCSASAGGIDDQCSAEEANQIIEKVADSNGKLQLLTAQVEDIKRNFPDAHQIPSPLLTSITRLLSDFIQKCKEVNEMKIDAFLSRSATGSSAAPLDPTPVPSLPRNNHPSPRMPESSNAATPEDPSAQSAAPSVKMFLGGIGARVSQGSQGFMSFMQRGATAALPPDSDHVSVTRRSDQQ